LALAVEEAAEVVMAMVWDDKTGSEGDFKKAESV
jgi:hypothetical protein